MLVHELLSQSAARTPAATAVIDATGDVTYAALDLRANRVAHALMAHGVGRRDRVILTLENSADFGACYFGILKAGAVAVPLPPGSRSDRLRYALADCAPVAAISDRRTLRAVADQLLETPLRALLIRRADLEPWPTSPHVDVVDLDTVLATAATETTLPRLIDVDLAAIVYTSGSTGQARGVMLTHLNLTANTASIVSYLSLSAADRVMVVLPFYYIYGLSLLHTHIAVGASLVIDNRFAFPNEVLKAMQRYAVTGLAGVPSTFAILLSRSAVARTPFPALRYVTQAGGPMSPARVREWLQAVPDAGFYIMYGATEAAARLAYLEPSELCRRPGSIGRAIPNVELRVIDDQGAVAAAGEVGEIVARGSNISPGYWNAPVETRAAFALHEYRTGDLGFADADGFFYLVGRKQDFLKVAGHRVGPKEIEDVLNEHHAVIDAAVVGAPDDLLGEIPVAFVAIRDTALTTPAELTAFCRRRLPAQKVPGRIFIAAELPRRDTGKVDREALRRAVGRCRAPREPRREVRQA